MKYLLTLTALLMMQSLFTQNIKQTQKQKEEINKIFTPEYVIETANVISIMKYQDSVIKAKNKYIKEKELEIINLLKQHREDLLYQSGLNSIINEIDTEVEEISEDSKKRLFKDRFHLYGSIEVPQFEFNKTILSGEFMIDLNIIEFGAVLNSFPVDNKLEFNYGIKARYKFF